MPRKERFDCGCEKESVDQVGLLCIRVCMEHAQSNLVQHAFGALRSELEQEHKYLSPAAVVRGRT